MRATKAEPNSGGVGGAGRFVFEGPDPETRPANEASQPMTSDQPAPGASLPRPTRPFPISSRDENPKRGNWWNKIEFIFACIAVSVSASNIFWRLPYFCYSNGGVIFFILFVIGMILISFPYTVLEMALGQFSSSGFISVWNFSPLFKGFGVVAVLYLALGNVVSTVSAAYHLLYAFFTVKSAASSEPLPWTGCSHPWNTPHCFDRSSQFVSPTDATVLDTGSENYYYYAEYTPVFQASPEQEYFNYLVGDPALADLTRIGAPKPSLVLALLVTWGFILVLTCFGAKWTGKVAYILMPATVILLFAMLIRGATLPGARDGLVFYFHPDLTTLASERLWIWAIGEVFFSGFLGAGVFTSLSSYNKFHNNLCLDALFVVGAVILANLIGVLIVGTFAGFYSWHYFVPVNDFATSGIDVTLVALPSALAAVPAATAWTCVHFLLVFLLLTSTSIYVVQALLTTLLDVFHRPHSLSFTLPTCGIICVLSFLISLPMVTEGGLHVLFSVDYYTLLWAPPAVAIVLPLVSVWVYGTTPKWNILRLSREIQTMVGCCFALPIRVVFLPFWACIVPFVVAVYVLSNLFTVTFDRGIFSPRPVWMGHILLALGLAPIFIIPICVGIYQICKRRGYAFFTKFQKAAQSSEDWGPPVDLHRQQVGYSRLTDMNPHQLNSEIRFNPATPPPVVTEARAYSPPPPAYNELQTALESSSPGFAENLSPAPSSVVSGLPASPVAGSATGTMDSNRLYPTAPLDYATGADTNPVNLLSEETTL